MFHNTLLLIFLFTSDKWEWALWGTCLIIPMLYSVRVTTFLSRIPDLCDCKFFKLIWEGFRLEENLFLCIKHQECWNTYIFGLEMLLETVEINTMNIIMFFGCFLENYKPRLNYFKIPTCTISYMTAVIQSRQLIVL